MDASMTREEWIYYGFDKGWIGLPKCSTHDIVDLTDEEEAEFDNGGDPCVVVMRLWDEAPTALVTSDFLKDTQYLHD